MDDEIITPGMSEREVYIRRRVKRLAEFYRHLTMYIVIMSVIWIASLLLAKEWPTVWWRWWTIWPTIGWGIAVLAHGLSVLPNYGEHLIRMALSELIESLDPEHFWQVHRGTVVNINFVASSKRDGDGRVTLNLRGWERPVSVSRAYSHLFKQM